MIVDKKIRKKNDEICYLKNVNRIDFN